MSVTPPDDRVSAVVLTHNRVTEVTRTLERLLMLPERPAVLVVDNGSSDGTAQAVRRRFPDVSVLALPANLGAAGRNAGLAAARTPYVALVDDDTWWAPGSLRRAADVLDAHPRLAVITARVLVGPEGRLDPACHAMARSPLEPEPDLAGKPVVGFLAGASMVRRDAVLSAGGFERRFFLGGEEALLTINLMTRGWRLAYVDTLVVHHHPSPRRDTARRRRLLVRNALWVAWLRRPFGSALRETIRLLGDRRYAADTWRGALAAVTGMAWVLRQRRVVPPELEAMLASVEARPAPGSGLRPRRDVIRHAPGGDEQPGVLRGVAEQPERQRGLRDSP